MANGWLEEQAATESVLWRKMLEQVHISYLRPCGKVTKYGVHFCS